MNGNAFFANPWTAVGMGILGGNTGQTGQGAFASAMRSGLQAAQTSNWQSMQAGQQELQNELLRMQIERENQQAERQRRMQAMAPGLMAGLQSMDPAVQEQARMGLLEVQPDLIGRMLVNQMQQSGAAQQRERAVALAETLPEGVQRERARIAGEMSPDALSKAFIEGTGVFEGSEPPAAEFGDVKKVRDSYIKNSAEWRDARNAYERMAASRPTGPGDISLLVGYMKMLDPGSVVREGEFATAENAGGVAPMVRNLYNRIVGGERLTDEQRKEFMAQARELMLSPLDRQITRELETQAYGARFGMRPEDITPRTILQGYRRGIPEWQPPVVEQSMQPRPRPPEGVPTSGEADIDDLMRKYLGP